MTPNKKRQLVILIFFLGIFQTLLAQQVSVLPQFFASNPIIKRDPTFEQLQRYLSDANRNMTPGLSENVTKKLAGVRQLVEKCDISFYTGNDSATHNPVSNGTWVKMKYTFFSKRESTRTICRVSHIDSLLSTGIAQLLIDPILDGYPAPSSTSTSLIRYNKIILYLIAIAMKGGETDISQFSETAIDNQAFSSQVIENLTGFISAQHIPATSTENYIKALNVAVRGLLENIKSKISEGLYQLDESIQKSKSDLAKRLVSANTGVGVNQDEGAFGGGLILTWVAKDISNGNSTQFSVFTNGVGQAGKDSTATKQPFLCGVNFEQQIGHRTQLSFLASTRYNQQSLNGKNWLFEGGIGFLTKSQNNLIWGVSAFYQYINETVSTYDKTAKAMMPVQVYSLFTAGITFRGDSNTSPTVLIGVSNQKGWTPILQISYPINFAKQ